MDGLFDWLGGMFTGGGTEGYSGLTPDQSNLLQQQGWFPRPDMVLPNGTNWAQPPGYSNLTPAQISTQNQLGYFSNPDAQQPEGLLGKLKDLAGSSGVADLQKAVGGLTPQPRGGQQPMTPTRPPAGLLGQNPYHNLFTPNALDPKLALQRFQRGY